MSVTSAGSAGKAGRLCSSAQVGEWLKPADCKSAPLRRYEGSNPSLCTRVEAIAGVSEAGACSRNPERSEGSEVDTFSNRAGCIRCLGSSGMDDFVRPAATAYDAGNSGVVRG